MKKLIAVMTLTTLGMTPALAQNYPTQALPEAGGPYVQVVPPANPDPLYGPGYGAYAAVPAPGVIVPGPGEIIQQPGLYRDNHYLGWDPDPNIRSQLLRDGDDWNAD